MSPHDCDFHDLSVATPAMNRLFQNLVVDYQQFLSGKLKAFVGMLIEYFFVFVDDPPNFGQVKIGRKIVPFRVDFAESNHQGPEVDVTAPVTRENVYLFRLKNLR